MKEAGTQISEVDGSKVGFISDEVLQKLLSSYLSSDRLLGFSYLVKKYPLALVGSKEDEKDSGRIQIFYESIYKYTPITDLGRTGIGVTIKKHYLT